jgi:hypothetical protein
MLVVKGQTRRIARPILLSDLRASVVSQDKLAHRAQILTVSRMKVIVVPLCVAASLREN